MADKTCVSCRFLDFRAGCPGYSEMTPGYDASLGCLKNHWELDSFEDGTHDFKRKMLKASTCPDYTSEAPNA